MRDDEIAEALREMGEAELPPAPDDPAARRRVVDAMVRSAHAARDRRSMLGRRWVWFAACFALVLGGGALTWRLARPAVSLPRAEGVVTAAQALSYAQCGEVLVVGSRGIVPSPLGRPTEVAAEDRVATLAGGRATLHLGARAAVQLSESTEVVVAPSGDVALAVLRGSAQLDVSKLPPGERFVVHAPDADVTVHGTSFRVTVDDALADAGRTQVVVVEGVVTVHPTVGDDITLRAGDRWVSNETATAPPPPTSASAPSVTSATPATSPAASSAPSDLAAQNALLQQAAAARARGDAAGEARALDAFVAKFPKSAGFHDAVAAKMRAAARSGDRRAAARAAERYLALFPHGPLRDEALATARLTTP